MIICSNKIITPVCPAEKPAFSDRRNQNRDRNKKNKDHRKGNGFGDVLVASAASGSFCLFC